jgi:uncharacterized RDD family membrane protein YckC
MPWFYANAGQQVGPIEDDEFARLTREGVIQPATLVWREGMANWEPFSAVSATLAPAATIAEPAAPPAPPRPVTCSECGKSVGADETLVMNGATICASCKPGYVQKMREGAAPTVLPAGTVRYAGFWIRVVAKIIDGIIVGIPIMILYFVVAFGFGIQTISTNPNMPMSGLLASIGVQLGVQLFSFILGGLYTVYFVFKHAATPGKKIVGLKVIMADGSPITLGRSVGRYFAELVSGLACYIGYIIVGFDDQKRALHDHMCHTRVIYK